MGLLVFLLALVAYPVLSDRAEERDVCIIGGGAGGAAASVFLTDRNYSVILLDKDTQLGGHCDSVSFTGGNLEIGVSLWLDTFALNAQGLGTYDIGTADFVRRFTGVFPINFSARPSAPRYEVDMSTGNIETTSPGIVPNAAYLDALSRYLTLIATNYSWLRLNEYGAQGTGWYPDEMPADLLIPFAQWIQVHNFTALIPLFRAFVIPAGMGDWKTTEAWHMALQLPEGVIRALAVPNVAFAIVPSCQSYYNGIENFLGANNVQKNARFTQVKRKNTNKKHDAIELRGYDASTNEEFRYKCDDLIVAFPPTLETTEFLGLDGKEENVFENFVTRLYYDGFATVSGPITNGSFGVRNVNRSDAFDIPNFPAVIHLNRNAPAGPAAILAFSDKPISDAGMDTVIRNQIANIPSSLLTAQVNLTQLHVYDPHPPAAAINHPYGAYTQLKDLQGHRHTYYAGAVISTAGSYLCTESAFDLVKTFFPPQ